MATKKLTQKRAARLTEEEAGRHFAGSNLYLQVKETGAKSWLYRYQFGGRERWLGLGPFAAFEIGTKGRTLKEAEAEARRARALLDAGTDPVEARRAGRATAAAAALKTKTFEACAVEYFESHQGQWKNPHWRKRFLATLRQYAFPKIGTLAVSQIDTGAVLRVLDVVWRDKPDTADRVRRRIESILDWAAVRGYRPSGDNPARWKGHLSEALPPAKPTAEDKHHAAMPYSDVPAFVTKLKKLPGVSALAFEFLILTAGRSNEIIEARWSEIDLEKKLWVIPSGRMKEDREHRVPSTSRAIAILEKLPKEAEYIFIGVRKGQPIGKNSFLRLLDTMGHGEVTAHGFRSSFRTWAGEETSVASDICEVALSHVVGGKVQVAYQRGDLLQRRRELMEAWESFLAGRSANVTPISAAKKRRRVS